MGKTYDINEIRKVLPHGYPFLLIDRVVEMEPGKHIRAYKNVSYNEPFMQGHFRDCPVMPGVLLVECLAQAGAFSILSVEKNRGKVALLVGLDKMKFRGKVVPGDRLDLEVNIMDMRENFGISKVEASVNGQTVVSGTLSFFIEDAPAT